MSTHLDDPAFEPSDAQLADVAVRAFACADAVHVLEQIRVEIAEARDELLRDLDERGAP